MENRQYSAALNHTKRRKTREVRVGSVLMGGDNPIRIQSMTTTDTRDVDATVEQTMRLFDIGCEIVRFTVQGKKEAAACEAIKNKLVSKGYNGPIVADIHFYPPAAMDVVEFVDKVRINPGNFADRRATFKVLEYNDVSYAEELVRIEEKFAPLVLKCKKLKRAMRIGTNHGSLSDRVMNRFGDTPSGMVESAIEYANVCRKYDYHDFCFSMKASNTLVMIEAYRLLVARMYELGWDYPLHLGVTEAGFGDDGRIKSAIGIGSLLLDGLGDTIRVSLTEDPEAEIDPCKRLQELAKEQTLYEALPVFDETHRTFFTYGRKEKKCDLIFEQESRPLAPSFAIKEDVGAVFITNEDDIASLKGVNLEHIVCKFTGDRLHRTRALYQQLEDLGLSDVPLVLSFEYTGKKEDVLIKAAAECGSLLCDGIGDSLQLKTPYGKEFDQNLMLSILQGTRLHFHKTEFISCPSCGRTLFDLQTVSQEIRDKTAHLPGVKIAIMGCIVNGPGEMADSDFGYVGSKPGMIDLYVKKECVERNIPMSDAVGRLVELLKAHDKWVEPEDEEIPALT